MSQDVNVSIKLNGSEEFVDVSGSFTDLEWECLGCFLVYVEKLTETDLIKNGGPGRLTMSFDENKSFSYETQVPEEDRVIGLLHRLRPFLLNNEDTQFNKICNILTKRLEAEEFRHFIKYLKDNFLGKESNNLIHVISNGVKINTEEMLHKWLNAHEYHRDRNKQRELESLHKLMPLDASRAMFIMMLYEKSRTIIVLANLVHVILGRGQKFEYGA